MLWVNKHARFRNNLSPYLDGRLAASENAALEAHLASCAACRGELDELRATAQALHDLPQEDAPRSFAITPAMLERNARAVARPLPALGLGMRLAGASVAVALAVVLVGDLTLGDGGSASRNGGQPAEQSRFSDMDTSKSAESGGYTQESRSADSSTTQPNAGATAPCPSAAPSSAAGSGAAGGAGGISGGGGPGEPPAASPTPGPLAIATPSPPPENIAALCGNPSSAVPAQAAPVTPAPSAADQSLGAAEHATDRAGTPAGDDGGISTLRVVEIVLAGVLIAILAGIALDAALRRRSVV